MRDLALVIFVTLGLVGCGDPASFPAPPPPPPAPVPAPAALVAVAGMEQTAAAGTALTQDPTILARDAEGRPLPGVAVQFVVTGGAGWLASDLVTTGADGRASTSWYLGPVPGTPQTMQAATGTLSAGFTATATALVPGATYLGRNGYIEFTAGDGPIVLSAPHGGSLTPTEIPDRTTGTTVTDSNTDPLARAIAAAIQAEGGERPHLIISRLRRTKLDPNREVVEAAAGNPAAIRAWREYHGFIEAARVAAAAAHPVAYYLDVHGHGHPIARLEWGYLLTATALDRSDAELNGGSFAQQTSIRSLVGVGGHTLADLLRGPASLGARFEAEGYLSVPSPTAPSPGIAEYFNGGYSTARHGSLAGGTVSGAQLETHFAGVRDTEANRLAFAAAAARVLVGWLGSFP